MNRIYLFIIMVFTAMFSFMSCSEDLDYRKACAEKNWPKAYDIVDKIKEQANEYYAKYASANGTRYDWALEAYENCKSTNKKYVEALKYVVLQEALVVLEESGENGIMRIVGIAKEHDAENWLYSELLDAAKKIGDDNLVSRFQKILFDENK